MKQTVGELVYKITGDIGNLEANVKKSEAEIRKLQSQMEKTEKSTQKAEGTFKKFGAALKGAFAFLIGNQVIGFLQSSVQLAANRIEQETKLAQVLRVSTNATDEQIQALNEQAEALEAVGVLDAQIVRTVQAQLATFDLRANSIKSLTPAILNYVAAEKGANATQDEAQGLTNGLAQALQGKFASLTAVGFVLDENTKKMISNGTETERIAALTEVLNSTYEGVNETLAGTFLGTMNRTKDSFEDLKEDIGFALMPALQVLGGEIIGLSGDIRGGSERINTWGLAFFRLAKIVTVVFKTFKVFGLGVKSGLIVAESAVATFMEAITNLRILIGKVRGDDITDLEAQRDSYQVIYADLAKELTKNGEEIIATSEEMGDAMNQALNPTEFKAVTDAAIKEYNALNETTAELGSGTEDAAEKVEAFREKLVSLIDESKKTSESLEKDLGESFKKFGEEIGKTFGDTNTGLAEIVLGAEEEIKKLKASLKEEDDSKRRKELKDQIKEQEEILAARKGFEERQVEQISAIRAKLEEAGIDTSKIEGLNVVRTLEEEIAEQRRVNDLDEFTRFVEQQNAKIIKLTDDFLLEVSLTQDKISKQKAFEQELTDFMVSTTAVRTAEIDKWASNTILRHGEVAKSLQSLLSLQSRVQSITAKKQFAVGGYVGAAGGEVHPGEYVVPSAMVSKYGSMISALENERRGGGVTNNKTVNAPISINANVADGLDFRTLSREMAWELGKR
jgi:hypothetical protein